MRLLRDADGYPMPEAGMSWVCVDLDGTLAEPVYPQDHIGEPTPDALEILEHYHFGGYRIAIYTARGWNDHHKIEKWLREKGLKPYVEQIICGKPVAGLYIDDRSWNSDDARKIKLSLRALFRVSDGRVEEDQGETEGDGGLGNSDGGWSVYGEERIPARGLFKKSRSRKGLSR